MNMDLGSIEEAAEVVTRIIDNYDKKQLKSPTIQQMEFGKDGAVRLNVSYLPVF